MSRMSVSMGVLPTKRTKKSCSMTDEETVRREGSRRSSLPKRLGWLGYWLRTYSSRAHCDFSCRLSMCAASDRPQASVRPPGEAARAREGERESRARGLARGGSPRPVGPHPLSPPETPGPQAALPAALRGLLLHLAGVSQKRTLERGWGGSGAALLGPAAPRLQTPGRAQASLPSLSCILLLAGGHARSPSPRRASERARPPGPASCAA